MPPDCAHHYIIESPNGNRLLAGRCKRCGATREDFAAWLDNAWVDDMLRPSRALGREDFERREQHRTRYEDSVRRGQRKGGLARWRKSA